MDGESTALMMAELMLVDRPLRVSRQLLALAKGPLTQTVVEYVLPGATFLANNGAEVGPVVVNMFVDLQVDTAYAGSTAISFSRGLNNPDPNEATTEAAMSWCSDATGLLADHSKAGLNTLCS